MQENLKKYMGNSENPKGTNIINNLILKQKVYQHQID